MDRSLNLSFYLQFYYQEFLGIKKPLPPEKFWLRDGEAWAVCQKPKPMNQAPVVQRWIALFNEWITIQRISVKEINYTIH